MSKLSRRSFLEMTAATSLAVGAPLALAAGCASVPVAKTKPSLDTILDQGARVMWIAPHPDDEILVGSILAWSSLVLGNPLYMLVLTHGDGGECCRPEGCRPDLKTVRGKEMQQVAGLYRAELQHEYLFNAPLPVSSFPKRHEIAKIWMDQKDVVALCAEAIRRYKPDVLFTFHPVYGATGHPEHQLGSRFATAGVRLAADATHIIGNLPAHRVPHVYYGVNRHWLYRMLGKGDPGPVTEIWDASRPCIRGMTCYETMASFTEPHRSQGRDMGAVREVKWIFTRSTLCRVDPFTQISDPFEPA